MGLYRVIAIAVLVSAPAAAETSFYQCKDKWGQPVFSQRPCGGDAAQGSVEVQNKGSGGASALSGAATLGAKPESTAPEASETSSTWDKVTASRKIRENEAEVERRESKIERLEKERDSKIAELDRRQKYANNNLAGAQFMESLATEMQAVNSQYGGKIDSENRKIDRLLDEIDRYRDAL